MATSTVIPSFPSQPSVPQVSQQLLPKSRNQLQKSDTRKPSYRPGYDAEIFTSPPNENLFCSICRGIYRNPVHIGCKFDHILCKLCYVEHIKHKKECPLDRHPLSKPTDSATPETDQFLHRMIGNLECKCIHHSSIQSGSQCNWTGTVLDLDSHLESCTMAQIHCPLCNHKFDRQSMEEHMKTCEIEEEKCPNQCGKTFSRLELQSHKKVCPNRIVACRNKNNGCKAIMQWRQVHSHINNECPFRIVECPFAKYGCKERMYKKDFSKHNQINQIYHLQIKTNFIENENEHLKKAVNYLGYEKESAVTNLRHLEDKYSALSAEVDTLKQLFNRSLTNHRLSKHKKRPQMQQIQSPISD